MAKAIVARGALTDQQALFARLVAEGVPRKEAWLQAGYQGDDSGAYRLVRLPLIAAAIDSHVQSLIRTNDAPRARRVCVEIMENATFSVRVRLDAAKTLLDRAGIVAAPGRTGAGDKQLSEMSPDEIRAYIDKSNREIARAETELANAATLVNPPDDDPNTPGQPDKGADFLD